MSPDRVKTGLASALVLLAFGPSLEHIHRAVTSYGQDGWVAWAIALSVDGLAAYVGLILQARHRAGLRRWDAVAILLVTVAATVSAQVVTAQPTLGGVIVAVWPAVAFLALLVLIELDPARKTVKAQSRVQPKVQAPVKPQVIAPMNPAPAPVPQRAQLHAVTRTADPKMDRAETVAGWVQEGRPWAVMVRDGASQFGVSESTMKRLINQARGAVEAVS